MNSRDLRKIILEELSHGRPARKQRKLGLVDYLNESSDKNLLEISDEAVISTGKLFREMDFGDSALGSIGDSPGEGEGDEPVEKPAAPSPTAPAAPVEAPPEAPPATPPLEPSGVTDADDAPASTSLMTPADSSGDSDGFEAPDVDPGGAADGAMSDDTVDPADSIMNTLLAGAAEETAARDAARTGVEAPDTTPPPPSDTSSETPAETSPEPTSSGITDRRALSRYLDQVARGEIEVSISESRRHGSLNGLPRARSRFF